MAFVVLLELDGSRVELEVTKDTIKDNVGRELEKAGISLDPDKPFILQKWSNKWCAFIDTNFEAVKDGDKLTIASRTSRNLSAYKVGGTQIYRSSISRDCPPV